VAIGNSLDECIENVNKYSSEIKGHKVDIACASTEKLKEIIAKAAKIGIVF
jgi:hypothetical protein